MLTEDQSKLVAKRMLQLVHQEIGHFKGIMTDHGLLPVTRKNVVKAAMEYGQSFKLKREPIETALDLWKDKWGFGKFKTL